MGWELKGLSKDFKASKIKINVKGAMYAERTKSKSVLTNNLLLNLYNLAPQKPIDFFAQDFLQPLVEKVLIIHHSSLSFFLHKPSHFSYIIAFKIRGLVQQM